MNHKVGQWVFAISVGLVAAGAVYRWASDPAPGLERALQEQVVLDARQQLATTIGIAALEIVDPLARNRVAGKGYVYRNGDGWEVSGFYRRDEGDSWHPWLMSLDASRSMTHLKVEDEALVEPGMTIPELEVLPGAIRTH